MSDIKITGNIVERDGYKLDAAGIADAHRTLFRVFGHRQALHLSSILKQYLLEATAYCDAATDSVPREDRAMAAMNYLRAMADGAEQLFKQVKAKGN